MDKLITVLLLLMAAMCVYPSVGVLSGGMLEKLYGVPIHEPNLLILMRHRAVLYGCIGVFLVFAAFRPGLQLAGLLAGAVALGSYVLISLQVGGYNELLGKLVRADGIAAALALAAALSLVARKGLG